MKEGNNRAKAGFSIQDNTQAPTVKHVKADAEQYDMGRVRRLPQDSKGYNAEAWNYEY